MQYLADDDLKWNLILNGDSLKKELGDINLKTRELEKTNKAVRVELQKLESQGKKNSKEWIDLNNQLKKNSDTISTNKLKMAALRKEIGIGGLTMRQLGSEAKGLRNKLNNAVPGTAEWKKYDKQLKAVNSRMGQLRGSASRVNKTFGLLKRALPIISVAALGTGFKRLTSIYERFEEKTANLSSLTGLQGKQLEWLAKTAKETSSSIVEGNIRITKSADDIVDAYTKVGSQRPELLKNKEALAAVTKDALILAEAGKMVLGPATESLTNIMNQFSSEADDSRRIINAVAAGSKVGAADIPYLSQAIEEVGTTMKLMNIETEEGIGLIEAIAPRFKKASIAGNSLDKVLLKMKDQNIGYVDGIFDMNTAINELARRFEAGETASSIFGVEHAKMAEIIVQSKDKFNEYTTAVTGTNIALEQAATNTDTQIAKRQQEINKIHNLSIALGEKLAPAMTGAIGLGGKLLAGTLAVIGVFDKYKHIIIPVTAAIITYTVAIQASVIWDKVKVFWTGKLNSSLRKLWITMKANPWAAVAAGVALLVTGIITLINHQKEAREETNKLNETIAQETSGMNLLFDQLKKTNISHSERRDLIKEINEKYGEYLPSLLTEQTSLEDIKKAQVKANEALMQNIILKSKRERLEKIYSAEIEEQRRVLTNNAVGLNEEQLESYKALAELLSHTKKDSEEYANSLNAYMVTVNKFGTDIGGFEAYTASLKRQREGVEEIESSYAKLGLTIKKLGSGDDDDDEKVVPGLITEEEFKISLDNLKDVYKNYQLGIKEQYYTEQINRNEFNSRMYDAELEHLNSIKALQEAAGKDIIDIDTKILDLKIKSHDDFNALIDADIEESIDEMINELEDGSDKELLIAIRKMKNLKELRDKDFEDEKKQLEEKYKLYTNFAADVGATLGKAISSGEMTLADFGKSVILMALEVLKKQAKLAVAQATIGSLASAESIATFGIAGLAKAAILTGLIEAAYQGVAGMLGGHYDGGYTGDGNPRDVAGVVHKKEFVANARATSNPTIRPFLDMINQAQIDGTIATLDFNRILAAQRVVEAPVQQVAPTQSQIIDPEFVLSMQEFNKIAKKGFKAYVVYTEFEEVTKEVEDIRESVTV